MDKPALSNYNDAISMPAISLRKINNILLIVVVAINLYVISVPFLPQILYQIQRGQGKQQALENQLKANAGSFIIKPDMLFPLPVTATTPATDTAKAAPPTKAISQGNRVLIPAMALDQTIVEGTNVAKALDKGVWRWPDGSTPDQGSNTVLVGHRFTYTKPKGVFYFMDKLHQGDTVGVVWDGKTYVYKVTGTQVVPPTQTSILDPTDEPTLTMYTCTPLWLPKSRLVVKASLEYIQ